MLIKSKLIFVDKTDKVIGYRSKEDVHLPPGILHRAFSIFIFNRKGQLLVQKRSERKLLWPLVWSNSCCSHALRGQDIKKTARVRLQEELGFTTTLYFLDKLQYKACWKKAGCEHEITHIFVGLHNGIIKVKNEEVAQAKWIDLDKLNALIKKKPAQFTPWFKLIMKVFKESFEVFELVDKDNRIIGKTIRALAHGNPHFMHKAARLIIFDQKGRILLQKRSQNKDLNPGFWTTSVGGHVDPQESYLQAIIREAKEELGIKLAPAKLKSLGKIFTKNPRESELAEIFWVTFSGNFKKNPQEVERIQWFEQKKLFKDIKNNKIKITPNALDTFRHKDLVKQIFWQLK